FGPGDAALLIFPEFIHAEVRADAGDSSIAQNFAEFGGRVFGETSEAGIGIADGRAQLNVLKSGVSQNFDGAGKVFGDHFPDGPGLAPDGEAERIGESSERGGGSQAGRGGLDGGVFEEFSS